jgi:hypothetical protein
MLKDLPINLRGEIKEREKERERRKREREKETIVKESLGF